MVAAVAWILDRFWGEKASTKRYIKKWEGGKFKWTKH